MIYTMTPNPVLDLGGEVERLIPNEKSYIYNETCFPGGNAINVARIIKKFGVPVVAGGFLGGGIGRDLESLLKQEGVSCQFVGIQGNTRIGVAVSDHRTRRQTRLSFPGPKIRPREMQSLAHWIERIAPPALIVIGGSIPPGFSLSRLTQMLQMARRRGIHCVIDVPGKILGKLILAKPILIKPNLMEFQEMIGRRVSSLREVTKAARELTATVPFVCVSSVENGALLVTREKIWFGRIPRIRVMTTVGAGDSMVGAMSAHLWSLNRSSTTGSKGREVVEGEDLLRWGLAAARATLMTSGTMLGEYKQMVESYPRIEVKRICGVREETRLPHPIFD